MTEPFFSHSLSLSLMSFFIFSSIFSPFPHLYLVGVSVFFSFDVFISIYLVN